jgi:uncharacterized membrane protein YgcG
MKRAALFIMILSLVMSILVMPAAASSDTDNFQSLVIDRDDNLTATEEAKIADKLRWAESETDIIFLIAVYDISRGIPSEESVVNSCGLDTSTDDIVLLIIEAGSDDSFGDSLFSGYSKHYYEMFTWGVANTVVTDNSADSILDFSDVYDNIKGGDFYEGIIAFTEQTVGCIRSYRRGLIFGIIIFSLVAAAAAVGIVLYTYKKKLKSPIYPTSEYAELKLTSHTDIFLGKTVTRTKINTSSGGGGRSGGGGGSRGRR